MIEGSSLVIRAVQPEEQTKVIEAITSVIQALSPVDAITPVEVC